MIGKHWWKCLGGIERFGPISVRDMCNWECAWRFKKVHAIYSLLSWPPLCIQRMQAFSSTKVSHLPEGCHFLTDDHKPQPVNASRYLSL